MKWLVVLIALILCIQAGAYYPKVVNMNPPKIKALRKKQLDRMEALTEAKRAGMIGEKDDGYLAVKDIRSLTPAKQKEMTKLTDEENADRKVIYKEIAAANKFNTKELYGIMIKNHFEIYKATDPKGSFYYQANTWYKGF